MTATTKPRFRLTAPVVDEDSFHASVAKALTLLLLPPAVFTSFPAGGYELSAAAAARLVRLGVARGWPDILIVYDGRIHGLELKRAGATLSRTRIVRSRKGNLRVVEGQRDVHPRLLASGMKLAVCDSLEEVLGAVAAWGIPTRVVWP